MAEEIPKKTVVMLLVLVIVVSVLSTLVVLTAVGGNREEVSQQAGVETAAAPQKEGPVSGGTVSLIVEGRGEE